MFEVFPGHQGPCPRFAMGKAFHSRPRKRLSNSCHSGGTARLLDPLKYLKVLFKSASSHSVHSRLPISAGREVDTFTLQGRSGVEKGRGGKHRRKTQLPLPSNHIWAGWTEFSGCARAGLSRIWLCKSSASPATVNYPLQEATAAQS